MVDGIKIKDIKMDKTKVYKIESLDLINKLVTVKGAGIRYGDYLSISKNKNGNYHIWFGDRFEIAEGRDQEIKNISKTLIGEEEIILVGKQL